MTEKNVYCYERMEIPVNPEITHIKYTYDDGSCDTALAFDSQPVSFIYDTEGTEHTKKCGEIYKCIRYTPFKTGNLKASFYSGDTKTGEEFITVLPSDNHGYVKLSEKDRRYFEFSDGESYFPVGINMAFPMLCGKSDGSEFGLAGGSMFMGLRQYERWFKKASKNGVNMVRIWLGHEYFCPDTENAGEFDLAKFSKIDSLLNLAKKYNLKLKLTLEQFRYFNYDYDASGNSYADDIFRKFNKRIFKGNSRCGSMTQWLESFGDVWLLKVSELAKRYAGDTSIFAVELWNEMNSVSAPFDLVLKWNEKFLPQVKKLFPQNMVINSLGSLDWDGALEHYNRFCWDKSDFRQMHRYLDQGAKFKECTKNPIELITDGFKLIGSKNQPLLLAETGAVNNCHSGPFKYYPCDDDGIIFADCVYTPIFAGSCGCGNMWHWDERYVESKKLYSMYNPIKTLIQNVDFASENFVPLDISTAEAYILLLEGKNTTLGYIRNKSSSWDRLLRNNEDIREINLELSVSGRAEIIKIWDDSLNAKVSENKIILENLGHGVMFQIRRG